MSSFKENNVSVCQTLERIVVPILVIASTTFAGMEAYELMGAPQAVGGFAGFVLGTVAMFGNGANITSSDEPLDDEPLDRTDLPDKEVSNASSDEPLGRTDDNSIIQPLIRKDDNSIIRREKLLRLAKTNADAFNYVDCRGVPGYRTFLIGKN